MALKANVQAVGKYVGIDKAGQVTSDPSAAVGRLPVFTDHESLRTLVSCARAAGGQVRVGSDHRGDFGGRLGHADGFRLIDDTVVVDLHFLKSARDRNAVLEVATKTPALIALSADGDATFTIRDGRAFLRFATLGSVDLVSEGACTPGGLFSD